VSAVGVGRGFDATVVSAGWRPPGGGL